MEDMGYSTINLLCLGCNTGRGFLPVYGGEAHEGRYEAASKLNQATGRYCVYRKLLDSQISSQISPRIPDTAVF